MGAIKDVGPQDFEAQVLARSKEVPVVVDFWAGWCAPCRMLGPTLEREVEALGGRVELAKVDVEQAPELSARFSVQGIPAVMAFRDGKVVADFTGARDARFVRGWLASLVPSQAAQALAAANDPAALRPLLLVPEVADGAALKLARLQLDAGALDEALALLDGIKGTDTKAAQALRAQVVFARDAASAGGEAAARARLAVAPDDLEASWTLACSLAARREWPLALEAFLHVVSKDRRFRDDGARKAMLSIFESVGPAEELTRQYRRKLQLVL